MANKVSSHIYDLIYSLSSSEKRYFKLFISKHIGKHNDLSLKLFDLIVRNERNPIEKIEKKITFTEHPSRLKNYLYDSILKSLETYHASTSISIKIRKLINQIENLYNKALYNQCIVLAKKTLKEIDKIDNQNFKLDCLSWYMNALKQVDKKDAVKIRKELFIKQQDALEKLRLEKEYGKLNFMVFNLLKQIGTDRTQENKYKLKELVDNPLLSDYSFATSLRSKASFNSIKATYYQYLMELEKVGYYLKQNLLLYEDFPATKELEQYNYITSLNNYALHCATLKDFEKADYYFSKLEHVESNTLQVEVKKFEYLSANRLGMCLTFGELKRGLDLVNNIEDGLKKYRNKINPLFEIIIYENLCYLFFATQKYKKALKYNNLILNREKSGFRMDTFRFARMMNLLIHYELGDNLSLEYFFNSTSRHLKTKDNIYAFEEWFIIFFGQLLKLKDSNKKIFFKEKELELLDIFKNKNDRAVISHMNILAWIRSKLENIPIAKAIQEYWLVSYEEYVKKRS